ncbi:GtrA family protein [Qipengyuania atrilutea]|uniref:GtrA family protein n=1 Tax=Qipengyuania atrilutea TaxID=2744473 RepID=A0A850HAX2_9SPHN|nr:GtrA family protein [Actirhodobacter atriluteus]NVD44219.1 GtrA family protein [Actirhodobacter atriluteus]
MTQQNFAATAREAMRFGAVGVCATLTYVAVSMLANRVGWPTYACSTIAYVASAVVSYFGHGVFTFRSTAPHREKGLRFLAVSVLVYALTNLIVFIVMDFFQQSFLTSTFIIALCIPLLIWIVSRTWVFGSAQ